MGKWVHYCYKSLEGITQYIKHIWKEERYYKGPIWNKPKRNNDTSNEQRGVPDSFTEQRLQNTLAKKEK